VSWLIDASWQAGVLALLVLIAETALGRRLPAELRHALWLAVALRLLVPPAVESPVAVTPPSPGVSPAAWAVAVWALGVALCGLALLWRTRSARAALLEQAAPLPPRLAAMAERASGRLGLRRPVRLLLGSRGPAAFGILRPTVVVPRRLVAALDDEALEHVLLHELAHVKRGDLLVQALFGAIHAVYWFHPLVWVACRRACAAREMACDATVAAVLRDATPRYRRTLLLAALLAEPAGAGAAAFRGRGAFLARVRALERETWRGRARRRIAAVALALLLLAAAAPGRLRIDAGGALRAQLARGLAEPEAHGCLELRRIFLRAIALETRNP
jgi:beta-lactamase regulating signal transducer with metallopeptidase domain